MHKTLLNGNERITMKRVVSILILAMLVLAMFAVTGCKSNTDTGSNDGFQGNSIPGGTADVSQETIEALQQSGEVSVYTFGDDMTSTKPIYNGWFNQPEFVEYFEAVYGGKLTTVNTVWENWESKFITDMASGDAPDVLYIGAKNWPKVGNRGLVFSVSELKEKGVLGLDHPVLEHGQETVAKNFTFKNEVYGFALQQVQCFWAIVNTDLYKKYEVKSPVEYYNEGLWNFDTFVKSGNELTKAAGTDDAGNKAASGYFCWDATTLIRANGQQLIGIDPATGNITNNMDKNEVIAALEIYSTGMKSDGFMSGKDTFSQGNIGILGFMDENMVNSLKNVTFNWDVVPFPTGPNNTTNQLPGSVRAWAVSTACENPQGAVNLIIALNAAKEQNMFKVDESDVSNILGDKPETLQMMKDNAVYGVNDNMCGVGNLWGAQWNFWGDLRAKTPIETIQTYMPAFNAQIQQEMMSAN